MSLICQTFRDVCEVSDGLLSYTSSGAFHIISGLLQISECIGNLSYRLTNIVFFFLEISVPSNGKGNILVCVWIFESVAL